MTTSTRLYLTTKSCKCNVFEVHYGFICNHTLRICNINSYHAANSIQFMPEVIMCTNITCSVAMCNVKGELGEKHIIGLYESS